MAGWAAAALVAAIACTPAPPPEPSPAPRDEFATVRATAEAAYQTGSQMLMQDDLERALVALNQAKVNDPDSRADIQAALDETVRRIQALPPPPTRTPIPTLTPLPDAPSPRPAISPVPSPGGGSRQVPSDYAIWRDAQGRFSVAAPREWNARSSPQVEFGKGVAGFGEPNGKAEVTVAVDAENQVPSAELYAARMDIAMERTFCTRMEGDVCRSTGYSLDALIPSFTADQPSLRRNYTTTRRDAFGREVVTKGFQLTVLKGRTPYVVTGTSAAADYPRFEATFDQILNSFSFK